MGMANPLALVISAIALVVSITTAWLTLFRRGNLRMTRPALVGFLYDLPAGEPKIFFRAMLFATGKRGHIVESIFLKVRRGESVQTFNFWMHGETKALVVGSGIRVGEDGHAANHHFLPPKDGNTFVFLPGVYTIDVYARLARASAATKLSTMTVTVTQEHAQALRDKHNGVLFNWGPDTQGYHGHISKGPTNVVALPVD